MTPIFFAQTAEPLIELPVTGEVETLISLEIPKCYQHNLFKIDAFFEMNFLVGDGLKTELDQNVPFAIDLNYQLFDGPVGNCIELTPRLAETISGTVIFNQNDGEIQQIEFESNTTPNLTIVREGLTNEALNLVANINNIQGALFPFVNFRSMNVSMF